MGMDVYGVKPLSGTGKYFRNTASSWAPLWAYVSKSCSDLLTSKDIIRGHYNSGHKISERKAVAVGKRLLELIEMGNAQAYERRHRTRKQATARESRSAGLLAATRVAKAVGVDPGKSRFTVSNLKAFANFCVASGGFEIW
jgi:hypothetical protein